MLCVLLTVLCVAAVSARHDFIVGGSEATVGQYKYQISLRYYGSHTCGGSLIGTKWVLTAAHCAYSSANRFSVIVGMHDQAKNQGRPMTHYVSQLVKHPDYQPSGNYPNDIALAELSTAVDLSNPYVETATMAPDDGHTYAGDECYISGWGLLRDGGQVAPKLQYAKIDALSNAECRLYWGSSISNGHICIFDKSSNSISACSGDSGGPMSCQRSGTRYVVGVASWVAGGCKTSFPGAYTRVSEYRNWVKSVSGI